MATIKSSFLSPSFKPRRGCPRFLKRWRYQKNKIAPLNKYGIFRVNLIYLPESGVVPKGGAADTCACVDGGTSDHVKCVQTRTPIGQSIKPILLMLELCVLLKSS